MRIKKYWEQPEIDDWDEDEGEASRDNERPFLIIGGNFGCRPRFFYGCRPRYYFGCRPRYYWYNVCYPNTFYNCFPRPCYPI